MDDWAEAISLGPAAAPAMLPVLEKYVDYEDPTMRKTAVLNILELGDPKAITTLRQFFKDEDWDVSMASLAAVVNLADEIKDKDDPLIPQYVDFLVEALRTPQIQTEEEVIRELNSTLRKLKPSLRWLGAVARATGGIQSVLAVHPEWLEKTPEKEELSQYGKALSYLPPVGGKIPIAYKGDPVDILVPSLTAEEQAQAVISLRKQSRLGEIYVHQLTVQGRLPDEFKFAALALILASPYRNDWEQPFFEAPWGKIAPLVHDGGNVDHGINTLWSGIEGRTDFLQRVALVHKTDVEELEQLSPREVAKLPIDTLASARNEQGERERLILEAKAYQRLALALHAYSGTIPKRIPPEIRDQLSNHWARFQQSMMSLLGEYGVRGVAEATWFNKEPRSLAHLTYGPRHEADWEPIKQELIRLENIRPSYPELRGNVIHLLYEVTNAIDRTIGFIPQK